MTLPQAYLVDDDEAIRDALSWMLKSRGIPCTTFASAEAFLSAWHRDLAARVLDHVAGSGGHLYFMPIKVGIGDWLGGLLD